MVTRQLADFRLLATTLLILSTIPAFACLNDRDTLAVEARQSPNVLRVITGRFERNPPLYYTMRIEREKADLAKNPNLLDDYDDIAVAYDRIGDDDDAIAWIEAKHKRLPRYNVHTPSLKEAWYRYWANVGTFWVHRWARHGADHAKIDEVAHARNCIAEALVIKPNAHFHRERYQLDVMNWMIDNYGESLAQYLADCDRDTAIIGLTGLVELGNAWESVDLFDALGSQLGEDQHALADFAEMRCDELTASGHKSMLGSKFESSWNNDLGTDDYTQSMYRSLRKEADDWQRRRTDYMMARLTAGRHPDTDPTFWNDWHDPGPPAIERPQSMGDKLDRLENAAILVLATLFAVGLLVRIVLRSRRRA